LDPWIWPSIFLPHTYPSYEAAISGKNLDFVRGGFSVQALQPKEEMAWATNSLLFSALRPASPEVSSARSSFLLI